MREKDGENGRKTKKDSECGRRTEDGECGRRMKRTMSVEKD